MRTTRKITTKNFILNFMKFSGSILFILLLVQSKVFSQNTTGEKACIDCHKRTVKKDILHGPVADDCLSCHKPTGKKHPLEDIEGFTTLEEGAALCYTCHEKEQSTIISKKYVHKPVSRGECLECHEVHSSNDSKFIFSKSPDLCYFCHDEIEKSIEKSAIVHSPAVKEGGCTECHSPHASNQKKLLVSNGKTLCLSCHDKTITKGDRKITNIGKLLKESKVVHEALDKSCNACHDPHASENKFLMSVYYPTGNYAPGTEENYELCFGCHDTDLLLAEKTKYATEFRNGEQNLHYLHVNREKGRTCNNCHNLHATNQKHLIPKTVKFGSWDMPLKYKELENGGSCKGCHEERKYVR
jgi:predicted CXXCH cytochrome family protein